MQHCHMPATTTDMLEHSRAFDWLMGPLPLQCVCMGLTDRCISGGGIRDGMDWRPLAFSVWRCEGRGGERGGEGRRGEERGGEREELGLFTFITC